MFSVVFSFSSDLRCTQNSLRKIFVGEVDLKTWVEGRREVDGLQRGPGPEPVCVRVEEGVVGWRALSQRKP